MVGYRSPPRQRRNDRNRAKIVAAAANARAFLQVRLEFGAFSDYIFVGPTICYAFMQAVGMVNDHEVGCFRYAELACGG